MSFVTIHRARPEHVRELVLNMRDADLMELVAASDLNPERVIINGIEQSAEAWSIFVGSKLMAIWGVVSLCGRRGWGWLLTTNVVNENRKLFWKVSRKLLGDLLERWSSLENFIDVRHDQALRWGRRLGFRFDPPVAYGSSQLPAQRFVITKEFLNV